MVHPELVRTKLEALSLLATTLERATPTRGGDLEVVLVPEETEAWLGVLNDARLALGVALGITEDVDPHAFDPDDPSASGLLVYTWLTELQAELISVVLG
jgi:hypothetical protein